MDKTADEFKRLHSERHTLYLQWQDTVEQTKKRDVTITQTGENYANAKLVLERRNQELEENK